MGVLIHSLAQLDLAYIQNWDEDGRWYPALREVLETIPVGSAPIVYSSGPDGDMKYQPIRSLSTRGVPAFHIVNEALLNGFRPMILRLEGEIALVTGIALERPNLLIPGMGGQVNYDDPTDPQIRRMSDIFSGLQ
jgi:hypothetical protein